MRLFLVDVQAGLVDCWRTAFAQWPEVEAIHGDILTIAHNAIVSPANSFGLMDGGIDALYVDFFGHRLQSDVLDAVSRYPDRELPVGAALLVSTRHDRIPWLIVAPTMRHPGPVPASHCFFAMTAILRLVSRNSSKLSEVYCPGLATLTGRVAFEDAAREMAAAYKKWREAAPVSQDLC